jgi:transposase
VAETLYRATAAGLSWPLPEDLDDTQLETRLYPVTPSPSSPLRAMPDWAVVHQELARKGVTLALLWQEYKAQHPDGYQ